VYCEKTANAFHKIAQRSENKGGLFKRSNQRRNNREKYVMVKLLPLIGRAWIEWGQFVVYVQKSEKATNEGR
jgi:hypothetical protein